jgi:NADPH-dependent glutamate synthase beta subunit-like oxidoreductase
MKKAAISSRGTIVIDGKGRIGDYRGIFAAGDVVSGPSSVVKAMASGKAAARHVIDYFDENGDLKK